MTPIFPLAWIMMLFHLRIGLSLYVIPKRTLQGLEGPWKVLSHFKVEHLEHAWTSPHLHLSPPSASLACKCITRKIAKLDAVGISSTQCSVLASWIQAVSFLKKITHIIYVIWMFDCQQRCFSKKLIYDELSSFELILCPKDATPACQFEVVSNDFHS